MKGNIDLVTADGLVEGWCWNEQEPPARTAVKILVDGHEVGRTIACHYRDDLREAGIGDGYHFFRIWLPDSTFGRKRTQTVTIADAASGDAIGDPFSIRISGAMAFDDRMTDLEARSLLLATRVEELSDAVRQGSGSAELFAVVGAFFQRLAGELRSGAPLTSEQHLNEALRSATKVMPRIDFSVRETPDIAVLVNAAGSLADLHRCLAFLKRAEAELSIRVTVLDPGVSDEVALICSIARGIRYLQTTGDKIMEWNQIAAEQNSPIVLILSAGAAVDEAFLSQIMRPLASDMRIAAVGGCVLEHNGAVRHAGLYIEDGTLVDCARTGAHETEDAIPVHALSPCAVAFRWTAMQACGGLDPLFGDDLGAAIIDLCLCLGASDWSLVCHPRATVALASACQWLPPALSTFSRARDIMRQRWFLSLSSPHPGLALIFGQSAQLAVEVEAAYRLRRAGHKVTYLGSSSPAPETARALRRAGALTVTRDLDWGSLQPTLIFAAVKEAATLSILSAAMNAQLVIGIAELEAALQPASPPALAV